MNDNDRQKPNYQQQNSYNVNYADGIAVVDGSQKLPSTTGEKIFDFMDWYGIGWLFNAGISVVAADYVTNKGGAYAFDKLADSAKDLRVFRVGEIKTAPQAIAGAKAFKDLGDMFRDEVAKAHEADAFNPSNEKHAEAFTAKVDSVFKTLKEHKSLIKEGKIPDEITALAQKASVEPLALLHGAEEVLSKSKSKSMLTLLSLMSGGFALMAPIKIAEDHKEQIVSKIDDMLGKKDKSIDEQAHIEARHKQLASEPNQTWGSVMIGRVAALTPIITFNTLLGSKDNILAKKGDFKGVDHAFDLAGEKIADGIRWAMPTASKNIEAKFQSDNVQLVEDVKNKIVKADLPKALVEGKSAAAIDKQEQLIASVEEMAGKASKAFEMSGARRMNKIAGYAVADVTYSLVAATATMFASKAIAPLFDKGGRKEDYVAVGAIPPRSVECDTAHNTVGGTQNVSASALTNPHGSAAVSAGGTQKETAEEVLAPFVMNGHAVTHSSAHHTPQYTVKQVEHIGSASLSAATLTEDHHAHSDKTEKKTHHKEEIPHDISHSKPTASTDVYERGERDGTKHERFAKNASYAELAARSKTSPSEVSYS